MFKVSKLQQVDNHGIYKKGILTLTGLRKSNEKIKKLNNTNELGFCNNLEKYFFNCLVIFQ